MFLFKDLTILDNFFIGPIAIAIVAAFFDLCFSFGQGICVDGFCPGFIGRNELWDNFNFIILVFFGAKDLKGQFSAISLGPYIDGVAKVILKD